MGPPCSLCFSVLYSTLVSQHGYPICPVRVQNVLQTAGPCPASGFWKPLLPKQNSHVPELVLVKVWPPRLVGHLCPAKSQLWMYSDNSVYLPKVAVSNLASTLPPLCHVCSVGSPAPFRKNCPPGKFPQPPPLPPLCPPSLSKARSTFPRTDPSFPHPHSFPSLGPLAQPERTLESWPKKTLLGLASASSQ